MFLMAKGMESNVSDDESDTTSLDDLIELVHEQKAVGHGGRLCSSRAATLQQPRGSIERRMR
jgi:hypothetical protein